MNRMAVEYTNRRGQTYYLHQGSSQAGKPTYHFTLDSRGNLADAIPAGFEVYEHPNGQVYLRKLRPRIFTDDEIGEVEREIERYHWLRHCRVDAKKRAITVFAPNQDVERLSEMLGLYLAGEECDVSRVAARLVRYSPRLRFVLVDEEQRTFAVQSYCHLGSADDWVEISKPAPLCDLVRIYVKHMENASWYELF